MGRYRSPEGFVLATSPEKASGPTESFFACEECGEIAHIDLMDRPYICALCALAAVLNNPPEDDTDAQHQIRYTKLLYAIYSLLNGKAPTRLYHRSVAVRKRNFAVSKSFVVATVLQLLGRPAHYSEIAGRCCSLFPTLFSSERSVHAILSRQENGVVWTGIKGTYALRQWGYEKPTKTLCRLISEIVTTRYKETARPVSLTYILAEVARYRKLVNRNSVAIATYCNPDLRSVGKDLFLPKTEPESDSDDIDALELDRILSRFEETVQVRIPHRQYKRA